MYTYIQKSVERLDARQKVTGGALFCADRPWERPLYGAVVYSSSPHARILAINTEKAKEVEGVVDVLTHHHVPASNALFGRFPVFAKDMVRYVGEGIALALGEDIDAATKGASLVEVTYQELPPLLTMDEALSPAAPPLFSDRPDNIIESSCHQLVKGDVEEGFAQSHHIIERTYETQFVEHAYIEPEAVVAVPSPTYESITIYGSIQNPYSVRSNVAKALGFQESKVQVINEYVGGTFGGKDESVMVMAARAAIGALKTRRPVKLVLTREESILESAKRHPYRFHFKAGVMEDGKINALESKVIAQGGAYNNKAQFCNWRVVIHTQGPYAIPHIKTEALAVYTNTIYGGAMRGFSSPQNIFAIESFLDEIGEELNITPLAIRERNLLVKGDALPTGSLLEKSIPAPLQEILEDIVERTDYKRKYRELPQKEGPIKKGIGLALSFRGAGLGAEALDATGAYLSIQRDGSLFLRTGLTDNGQGLKTAHAQIVAEVLGASPYDITYQNVDTSSMPDGGPTVASRGTITGGRAVLEAALDLKERLLRIASSMLDLSVEEIELKGGKALSMKDPSSSLSFQEVVKEAYSRGEPLTTFKWFSPGAAPLDHSTNQGEAFPTYSWNGAIAEVEVDTETGIVLVKKVTSAHDVGVAINPDAIRGQVYGGVSMGLGMALMEGIEDERGAPKSLNLDTYLIPTSMDMPEIEVVIFESSETFGPFGAKSLGEPACEVPCAAIGNAIAHATGKRIRRLPFSLERVLLGGEER